MKIAVLSGKGGTGKTFVSVNLACTIKNAVYKDCDVEEPDGELFLKPCYITEKEVTRCLPCIDKDKCISCRKCVDFCNFNALAMVKNKPLIFDEVCHYCGGCEIVCPAGAISSYNLPVGKIRTGKHRDVKCVTGIMNIGQASGIPVINAVLDAECDNKTEIIDCPPGCACSVMESIKDADYCIIVAEPTLFGLENFKMVYKLTHLLDKKCGVVINKYIDDNNPFSEFAKKEKLDIIATVPFSEEVAMTNSCGEIVSYKYGDIKKIFEKMFATIKKEVNA